jgi:hypothetical protein
LRGYARGNGGKAEVFAVAAVVPRRFAVAFWQNAEARANGSGKAMERETAKASAAAVRTILHQDWDPIGCGVPEDEYDSYLWPVLKLLQEDAPRAAIEDYLRTAARESMSCTVPEKRLTVVVDKLLALRLAG